MMTIRQFAEHWQLNRRSVQEWVRQGKIRATKDKRGYWIVDDERYELELRVTAMLNLAAYVQRDPNLVLLNRHHEPKPQPLTGGGTGSESCQ